MSGSRGIGAVPVAGMLVGVAFLYGSITGLPISGLNPTGQRALSLFFFTLVMWLTKPVPFAVSSLTTVSLLYVLGIVDTFSSAVSGFASRLIFFLILLLLLGNTISKVGLDELVARRLLVADTPLETIRLVAASLLVLSFMMPSALARTVAFLPIVGELDELWEQTGEDNFLFDSYLILGHLNPIVSMGIMTGGGMPILTSEFIRSSVTWLTWLDWVVLMLPPVIFIFTLSVLTILYLHPVSRDVAPIGAVDPIETSEFDRDQRIVMGVMVMVIVLWIIGSFGNIPTIFPPMMGVLFLSLPGINIIAGDDVSNVSWGIIFVFATMFSLLNVLESSGVLAWVVSNAEQTLPLGQLPLWQTVALLLALAFTIRLFFSTASAALLVLLPVMLQFGEVFGINLLFLSLALLITISTSTVFPFNTVTVLLIYEKGPVSATDVMRTGMITFSYGLFAIVLCWMFYWPMVS